MRRLTWLSFLLLLVSALPAFAVDYPCADNETSCDPFASDQSDSNPNGNFGGPTPTTCYALERSNQRCRSCETQYYDNGQPTGSTVCAYVNRNEACTCQFQGTQCSAIGSCFYFPNT